MLKVIFEVLASFFFKISSDKYSFLMARVIASALSRDYKDLSGDSVVSCTHKFQSLAIKQ